MLEVGTAHLVKWKYNVYDF